MEYSPILSIVTAVAEIVAAIWILRGPGRRKLLNSAALLILLLAGYQVIEILTCSVSPSNTFLPRFAFMVIAWLPPVGVLLISFVHPTPRRAMTIYSRILLILTSLIVIWISLDNTFVTEKVCDVVFARYTQSELQFLIYGGLYQIGLLSMLFLSAYGLIRSNDEKDRYLLGQILIGSIAFIVPALVVSISMSQSRESLPSVMCHFAILLAFFIVRLIKRERQ